MGSRTCWYAGGPGAGRGRGNSAGGCKPVKHAESPREPKPSAKEFIEEILVWLSHRTIDKLESKNLLPILEECKDTHDIQALLFWADFVLNPEVDSSTLNSDLEPLAQTIRAGNDPTKDQLDRIGLNLGPVAKIFVKRVINCVNEDRLKLLSRTDTGKKSTPKLVGS